MRYSPFYALGLLSVFASRTLSFEHSSNHYLRGHAQRHRRNISIGVSVNSGTSSAGHPTWGLTDSFCGREFYDGFTFEAMDDPTHGRVNYVDMNTAFERNLTHATRNSLILRSDFTTVLDPNGPGRDSIRLQSKKQWITGVSVLDLRHMPVGCGTWPAYWMTQHKDWPKNGEIDILEGVHDQPPNQSALHTVDGCTVASNRTMTGTAGSDNCSWLSNYNQGCTVEWDRQDSYGPGLNTIGGGWFVTERTNSRISIWFWGRKDKNVPRSVKNGDKYICTKEFGTPVAVWESSNTCDFNSVFGPENIIINLTFCGDWAGQPSIFNGAGCPGTCVVANPDYVNNKPGAFKDAYWDITSLKVYSRAL
ncbi:glycosidase C21B10,07 [Ceratobasidium theobromae]|uniref:Glycosidase C21B10,07 n=1 Tax=Ceratobasidium theobromae TaxID=1582974 RepID=A0A5N5QIN9_9AGAM|nr:glycosidase C21B10,07 [Ceratobasidium theobromae]